MFVTNNFMGRLQYETDEVVCINVYVLPNILVGDSNCLSTSVISQILINKETRGYIFNDFSIDLSSEKKLDSVSYKDEIAEIVDTYYIVRKKLNLE